MSKTNREWHEQNRMPRNPTTEQRLAWHLAHAQACQCRPIPASLLKLLETRGATQSTHD